MAVINYFASRTTMGPPALPPNSISAISGVGPKALQNTVPVGATDSANSTYLLFQDIPWNAKLKDLLIENDNLGAGSQIQIGLADPATGSIVGAAGSLSGNLAVSAAHSKAPASCLDGLAALTHTQTQQTLAQIAGDALVNGTPPRARYDVVITLQTAGGSAGNITGRAMLTPAG